MDSAKAAEPDNFSEEDEKKKNLARTLLSQEVVNDVCVYACIYCMKIK